MEKKDTDEVVKKIRIYDIIPVAFGVESWGKVTRELQATVASPEVEITLADLPDAPVKEIISAFEDALVAPLCVREALKAERAGYDAVIIDCLSDPGLSSAKEALSIPVVGALEAVLHYASMVGRRFSILISGYKAGRMLGADGSRDMIDLIRMYGFESKFASMRSVPASCLDFAGQQGELPAAMLEQAQLAIEEDGADSIISYGGIDIVSYLQEHLKVPVIDSVQSSVLMAESLVRMKLTQSKRAYPLPLDMGHIESLINATKKSS
jgi:allantoin racemase